MNAKTLNERLVRATNQVAEHQQNLTFSTESLDLLLPGIQPLLDAMMAARKKVNDLSPQDDAFNALHELWTATGSFADHLRHTEAAAQALTHDCHQLVFATRNQQDLTTRLAQAVDSQDQQS